MATRLLLATAFLVGIVATAQAQEQSRLFLGGPLFAQTGATSVFCNISNGGDASVTIVEFRLQDSNGNILNNFNSCTGGVLAANQACSIGVVGAGPLTNELITCQVIVRTGPDQPPQISGTLDARNVNATNLLYVIPLSQ